MINGLYDESRATQVVAYLLHLAGGRLELLKLTKLCYLAEKRSYEEFGEPLTGDRAASLDHGPILSETYSRTRVSEPPGEWKQWVKGRLGNVVIAAQSIDSPEDQLDALSRGDLRIIGEVWAEFGSMSASKLRNWTHNPKHCPEWDAPPQGSMSWIAPEALLGSAGFSADEIDQRLEYLKEAARLRNKLAA